MTDRTIETVDFGRDGFTMQFDDKSLLHIRAIMYQFANATQKTAIIAYSFDPPIIKSTSALSRR
jgi:hypothetical protein